MNIKLYDKDALSLFSTPNKQVLMCAEFASLVLLGWHNHWQCKMLRFQGTRRQTQGSRESH